MKTSSTSKILRLRLSFFVANAVTAVNSLKSIERKFLPGVSSSSIVVARSTGLIHCSASSSHTNALVRFPIVAVRMAVVLVVAVVGDLNEEEVEAIEVLLHDGSPDPAAATRFRALLGGGTGPGGQRRPRVERSSAGPSSGGSSRPGS